MSQSGNRWAALRIRPIRRKQSLLRSDYTAVTNLKFFFVTAVLITWIVIQLYNSIYCSIFGPVQKQIVQFLQFTFGFLLTSLWFANKILMIHGFDIAVCMCDDFSTPTIKSLPSLLLVFCRHWQISLCVPHRAKSFCLCRLCPASLSVWLLSPFSPTHT